jgi:hypothetical protein
MLGLSSTGLHEQHGHERIADVVRGALDRLRD